MYTHIYKNARFMYLQLTRLNSTGYLDWCRSRISLDKVGLHGTWSRVEECSAQGRILGSGIFPQHMFMHRSSHAGLSAQRAKSTKSTDRNLAARCIAD